MSISCDGAVCIIRAVIECICGLKDADASYDVNGRDNDPQPRYDPSNENRSPTL